MSEINLPNSRGFAWEFLRHNPVYREHACGCSDLSSSAGYLPQNWGLLRFEDPDIPASGANIFWSERACSSILWASLAEPGYSGTQYSVVPEVTCHGFFIQWRLEPRQSIHPAVRFEQNRAARGARR